ncbi:MAG: hypothetical protein MZW92_68540 [Comamonadaceae bacterium]|nr:hypothetical protein [Comamonadaceae bacterium]
MVGVPGETALAVERTLDDPAGARAGPRLALLPGERGRPALRRRSWNAGPSTRTRRSTASRGVGDALERSRAAAATRSPTSPARAGSAATTSSTGATSRSSAWGRRPALISPEDGAGRTCPPSRIGPRPCERGAAPAGRSSSSTPGDAAREALVFGLRLVEGVDRGRPPGADGRRRRSPSTPGRSTSWPPRACSSRPARGCWIPPDKLLVSNAILSRFI